MKVSGCMGRETGRDFRLSPTEVFTKANGGITRSAEKVESSMLMEMPTKASGKMTKPMVLAFTRTEMGRFMKVTGSRTSKMGQGCSTGPTAVDTRDSSKQERNTEEGPIFGLTAVFTRGIGMRTNFLDLGSISGKVEGVIRGNG